MDSRRHLIRQDVVAADARKIVPPPTAALSSAVFAVRVLIRERRCSHALEIVDA